MFFKKSKKMMSPMEADTFNKVCQLKSDHCTTKTNHIIINGETVYLKGCVMSKKEFDEIVKWYTRKQEIKEEL